MSQGQASVAPQFPALLIQTPALLIEPAAFVIQTPALQIGIALPIVGVLSIPGPGGPGDAADLPPSIRLLRPDAFAAPLADLP